MINPSIWSNDKITVHSRDERLLYIGLFSNADDKGRLPGSARRIRGIVFPHDEDLTDEIVETWLQSLTAGKRIRRWDENGETYIEFPANTWDHEQKMNYKALSKLPPYQQQSQRITQDLRRPAEELTQDLPTRELRELRELREKKRIKREEEKEKNKQKEKEIAAASTSDPKGPPRHFHQLSADQKQLLEAVILNRSWRTAPEFSVYAWIGLALRGIGRRPPASVDAIEYILTQVDPLGAAKDLHAVCTGYLDQAENAVSHAKIKDEEKARRGGRGRGLTSIGEMTGAGND